ncbi:MAG: hypothetical protein PVH00_02430 [Gemmatimonadota bacterium]
MNRTRLAATRRDRLRIGGALGIAWALAAAAPAAAQISLVDRSSFQLDLTGYVRTLTGIHDAGYDLPGATRITGFHGAVTRLKWTLTVPDRGVLTVHQRILASLTTSGASPVAGFGVSRTPGRAVDLSSPWIEEDRLSVMHDFDRLALTMYTPLADVTVGRQAVSWGTSSLFPVADLWSTFSPFELDTEEKPGIDAIRALGYPWPGVEVDAIVADRGSDGTSAGARVSASLADWELWAGGGKLWNEAMAMVGVSYVGGVASIRGEAVLARDTDAGETLDPRATLGMDFLGTTITFSAEYHYNGLGATDAGEYGARLLSPAFARGETYFLGRHYLGAVASVSPDAQNRLNLTASVLANLRDGSLSLTPVATYDFGRSARVSVGALVSTGDPPIIESASPLPRLRSEFGSYGELGFLRVSVYF